MEQHADFAFEVIASCSTWINSGGCRFERRASEVRLILFSPFENDIYSACWSWNLLKSAKWHFWILTSRFRMQFNSLDSQGQCNWWKVLAQRLWFSCCLQLKICILRLAISFPSRTMWKAWYLTYWLYLMECKGSEKNMTIVVWILLFPFSLNSWASASNYQRYIVRSISTHCTQMFWEMFIWAPECSPEPKQSSSSE